MARDEDQACAHSAMIGGSRRAREDESVESRDDPKITSPTPHSPSESEEEVTREQAEKRACLEDRPLFRCELEQKQKAAGIGRVGQDAESNATAPSFTCSDVAHTCNIERAQLYEDGILEKETLGADIFE